MNDEPHDGVEPEHDAPAAADLPIDQPGVRPGREHPGRPDPTERNATAGDPGTDASAPWERPRRWNHQSGLDATRVDDLLARLGPTDDAPAEGRRSRRRSSAADDDAVPAGELIAALSGDSEGSTSDAVASTPDQVVSTPANDPTESTEKISGTASSAGQSVHFPGGSEGGTPPPHDAVHIVHGSGEPPRRHWGWLYAGRSVAALVAIITLLGVGVEWKIKDRADVGILQNQVAALNTGDPSISTARTIPTVMTNSRGVRTTELVEAPTTYQPENILLLGSDTRAGGNAAIGGSNQSTADSAQSDTIMIAHISGDRQHVTILSIPRDTLVPAPTCKAWDAKSGVVSNANFPVSAGQMFHINNAYAVGGPKCTVTALQSLTGLGITRMIGIDFSGFEAMVNALGGVTVDICKPIVDTVLGTVVAKGGTQVIQGQQAISLVRARDVIGDTESDLARIRRQQVVLSAILRQVTQAGTLLNPAKLDRFLQAFTKNTFTDHVTLEDLVTLAGSLGTLDPAHVTFYTLPTVPSTTVDGALDVDRTRAPAIFDDLVNDLPLPGEVSTTTAKATTTPATPAPTANSLRLTVAPSKVALEIYNVSGQTNVATTTQQKLNGVGFHVGEGQLFKPDGASQTATTVLYAPTNRAAALTLAAAVPGSSLVVTPGLGSTVRLMLGSSYTGMITAVTVGGLAPLSLAAAASTGPSINTASAAASAVSTALSSVNAGAGTCA